MKKLIRSCLLFLVIFLTACGAEHGDPPLQTTIVGGSVGGAWSVFTEGIAETIRREYDGSIVTVEPGGIVENPAMVSLGKVPYGLSYAMTAYAAYEGAEPYDKPYNDIRAVSVVIPGNYYQFLVSADYRYDSLEEIINDKAPMRLALDAKGSAGEIITRQILAEYGVTYDDIVAWGGTVDHLSGSKTFEMMADNRMDATGDAVSVPSSDIIEATTTMDLKMFSFPDDVLRNVSEKLGMETATIPKNSYSFLQEDIQTLNTPAILIVHKDVPEEEVYQVTKAIYEHLDYLRNVHGEFQNLTERNMASVGQIPLHPGAEKFFEEKGMLDEGVTGE